MCKMLVFKNQTNIFLLTEFNKKIILVVEHNAKPQMFLYWLNLTEK